MAATTDQGYALASSSEEVALRRRLLFRLLRNFDFARPDLRGELISDPVPPRPTPREPDPRRHDLHPDHRPNDGPNHGSDQNPARHPPAPR